MGGSAALRTLGGHSSWPCEIRECDDRNAVPGWPSRRPACGSSQRTPQVTRGRRQCEGADRAQSRGPGHALLADGGAGISCRISRFGSCRIFRAGQRQAAPPRLPSCRDKGRRRAVRLGRGSTLFEGRTACLKSRPPTFRLDIELPQVPRCNLPVIFLAVAAAKPGSRSRLRQFYSSQFHSSIDEPLALSHRVGRIAVRLVGSIPRPTRTALTMSSDRSSRTSMPSRGR
jgi:hypothetical protein